MGATRVYNLQDIIAGLLNQTASATSATASALLAVILPFYDTGLTLTDTTTTTVRAMASEVWNGPSVEWGFTTWE